MQEILFLIWLGSIVYLWGSLWMMRPDGPVAEGAPTSLPLVTSRSARSICQLRGMGSRAFIAVRPDYWTLPHDEAFAAIMHETAHWKLSHVSWRLVHSHLFTGAGLLALEATYWWLWPLVIAAWYTLGIWVVGLIWRGHEYEADELACERCDRRALIRAVGRVTRDWSARAPLHPSVEQRAKALGICRAELEEIARSIGRVRAFGS